MEILVVTHGDLGESFVKSAEMIIGEVKNIQSVCLDEEQGIEIFKQNLEEFFRQNLNKKIIILCDLKNGSPYIQTVTLAKTLMKPEKFIILTGCNLPMLLEASLSVEKNIETLKTSLLTEGKNSIEEYQMRDSQEFKDEL